MSRRLRRDWSFWVQLGGLVGLWTFSAATVLWFLWRARELHHLGDHWWPALILGVPVGGIFITFAGVLTYLFVKMGLRGSELEPDSPPIDEVEEQLTEGVLSRWSWRFWLALGILGAITGASLYAWWHQLERGLGVTGLGRSVPWGLYITNFVFFFGISYGAMLVSAVLRVSHTEWRRPITRTIEAIGAVVLFVAAWNIVLDLGRPDRALKLILWGRLQSPLVWDVVAVTTYMVTCSLYLYLPMIPDLALMRKRVRGWRRPIYHLFSFGWSDTPAQRRALERCIKIVAFMMIPIGICVASVAAWVFSLTVQPLWHSTLFAPYFVLGAMFSGVAGVALVLAVVRRTMHLERYLRPVHFGKLGKLLLVLACLWMYFTGSEYLTVYYGHEPSEMAILRAKLLGHYAPLSWAMIAGCFVLPLVLMAGKRTRSITGVVIASVGVLVGMWIERFTIVVPTLERPRLGHVASYFPSAIELLLMAGSFTACAFMVLLFTRLFPVLSLWEMKQGREEAALETAGHIQDYFPEEKTT